MNKLLTVLAVGGTFVFAPLGAALADSNNSNNPTTTATGGGSTQAAPRSGGVEGSRDNIGTRVAPPTNRRTRNLSSGNSPSRGDDPFSFSGSSR